MLRTITTVSLIAAALSASHAVAQEKIKLNKGDRICTIGNTLAERMQHHGWLETYIQQRFPTKELRFRNLGFSADTLTTRPRSQNFGSPDSHLTISKADVVFAFFGYNESFAGEAGLKKFRADLSNFIDQTRLQKYNGNSAPRLVLFSPIAHENLNSPHLPDGKENNKRLEMYTKAMADVAKQKNVPFVDLFTPTKKLYAAAKKPLTLNGIHLTEEGNRQLGEVIDEALFGTPPKQTGSQLEKIRKAVLDRNLHWFNRYRVTDGYNVYGGRAKTGRGPDGLDNRAVMERELQILDVMTANRDKRIWAVAQGGDMKVDDSNTPPPLQPKTNRPGPAPGGKYTFLGGEEAIKKMTVANGMSVELFASEEQFPDLINPVQMSIDPDGRIWVAAWPTYPHWNPKKKLNDKLIILPDDDGDGKADRCIVFADGLHNPTGFEFWNGGVLVAQAPDILFLKDTDGDDKADVRIRILHGIDSADTHHTANSFIFGPAGNLYFQRGVFHVTNIETPWHSAFRSGSTGMYKLDLKSHKVEKHFGMGPNPHGNAFDRWGYQFATDGTSGNGFYIGYPGKGAIGTLYRKRVRPVPGIGILSSEHFPKANQGNLLICNVIGFLGVAQYRFVAEGAGFHAEEIEPIISSTDPNFRPSSVEVGGDGALYIIDWHNPLIGHLQHNLRDPNRDHLHGRVYRITAKGRPLMKNVKMSGRPIAEILEHLKSPTDGVRYRVRLELSGRDSNQVAAAAAMWAEQLHPKNIEHAQPLVETLWLHQQHRIVNADLLRKVLRSPEPHARAAATRVLADWANKIKDGGELLVQSANDKHPRVRAEAVVAAASYDGPLAAEVVFAAEQLPTDKQLDYVLNQTRGTLNVDQFVQHALKSGRKLSPAAEAYVLRKASVPQLLALKRTAPVYRAILTRTSVPLKYLQESLDGLAKLNKTDKTTLLVKLIEDADSKEKSGNVEGLSALLTVQSRGELKDVGDRIAKLVTTAKTASVRQAAMVALTTLENSFQSAFAAALRDKSRFREFLSAIPKIQDAKLRGQLYAHLRPLMFEMPKHLRGKGSTGSFQQGIKVDYFEPHPREKNVALETLARYKSKVSGIASEITINVPQLKRRDAFALRFTGMLQVDRAGKYTFFLSSDDGSRLYIGNELIINNDGLHGMKLKKRAIKLQAGSHPIVVTYFDNGGGDGLQLHWSGPGFGRQKIATNKLSVSGPESLQDLVVRAMQSVPGHESELFADLASLIVTGKNQVSAVAALRSIPQQYWAKDRLLPVAQSLAKYAADIPAKYRTSAPAVAALKTVEAIAELLPKKQANALRAKIADLEIHVIHVGTIPHRMIYDRDRIVVQAGKTVEFILSNSDNMPHNFAIVKPGSMEEIGKLAEDTAQSPDAMERHFIPKSPKVLLGSRLLNTGDIQALSFEVPTQPGVYPIVCTYPGHWRRMYAALYVVADLKKYLASPDVYVKANNLIIRDPLLKYSTKGKEWTYEDLESSLKSVHHGRNYKVGQHVFKMANCIACHRMEKEGQDFGPDLTKLDAKKSNPEHILKSILTPSTDIERKFQSYLFELKSGKVITGMIVKETPKQITILTDPLAKKAPLVVKASDIARRAMAKNSIMPEALVNRLSREEILDLIAYVYARGDQRHKAFKGHGHGK